jgi:signal transduction histidine kinase
MARSDKEGRTFLLLRYILIIAAAYLFLFEGKPSTPDLLVVLIALALLSNVLLAHLPERRLLRPLTLGCIVCADIAWIATGLWHKGTLGSDMFFLYFLVLFLAAVGQNLVLIVSMSVILSGVDLILFVIPAGQAQSIWTSHSLIRIPFVFIVALFYGYLAEQAKKEKSTAEKRIHALHEIDVAITSTLDLHAVLGLLLEKIDLFLPYTAATVQLFDKKTGELKLIASRKVNEEEWKEACQRAGPSLANTVFETKLLVTVRNLQTDSRIPNQDFFRNQGLLSSLEAPLIVKDEILGVLSFFTQDEHDFDAEEVNFVNTLAGQAAIAINNSQLYEGMKQMADELAVSNRVKDEFLHVMTHELRTPLSLITGYVEMVRHGMLGELNAEQEKALEKGLSRSNDLLGMITAILDATKLEAGAIKVESHRVHLDNFLNDLRLSCQRPLDKELTLKWGCDSDLPVVTTDGDKLKKILENLINNAIKFTKTGEVTVSARNLPQAKRVEFKVTDTGVGIPKESLDVMFEKFRQVDGSDTRQHGGVGVGLFIVKKFTELLGGEVQVESSPGKGSSFTVTLPYNN